MADGIGVMLGALCGNRESVEAFAQSVGKRIVSLRIEDDENDGDGALMFGLEDGSLLRLFDDGRSCCESRYMRTDDDLNFHVGATLLDAEVREGPEVEGDYETHETAFLHVTTSNGVFVVNTHNEHNGYYGGFYFRASLATTEQETPDA